MIGNNALGKLYAISAVINSDMNYHLIPSCKKYIQSVGDYILNLKWKKFKIQRFKKTNNSIATPIFKKIQLYIQGVASVHPFECVMPASMQYNHY